MRPALVEELEEMIGLPATLALVEQWGGISVYVPETMPEGHPISVQLGHDAAVRLSRYAGRSWLRVPRCARMLQERRDREIFRLIGEGWSRPKVARKFSLTERRVFQILAEGPPPPDPQLSLFISP